MQYWARDGCRTTAVMKVSDVRRRALLTQPMMPPHGAFDDEVFVSGGRDGPAHRESNGGRCKTKRDANGPVDALTLTAEAATGPGHARIESQYKKQ